ncbi:hypothetical protein GOP47_0029549 [Adiantum capillus-veneris]|nr:hypothetical protein GOP47_0029549 [Adiantum capillus-veneris]
MANISTKPQLPRTLLWRQQGLVSEFPAQEGTYVDLSTSQSKSWEACSLEQALVNLDRKPDLPSVNDFIDILQKCRANKNLNSAHRIYLQARKHGLEVHKEVGNYLVPLFVECGALLEAQQMFDRLVHRNVHSWTSLIAGYVQSGQSNYAVNLYQRMQEDHVHPNSFTLVAVLKAAKKLDDIQIVHLDVVEKCLERDLFVASSLIDVYAKNGAVWDAHKVFNTLPGRNIVSWTALIAGYAEHGPGQEAIKCFEEMKSEGVAPNEVTYICVLKGCGTSNSLGDGRNIYAEITMKGLGEETVVGSTVVDMFAKCGSLQDAQKTLNSLKVRDIVSWNALIAGYAEHGPGQEVLTCLEKMQLEKIPLDAVTFVYALKACGNIGAVEQGQELHLEIARKALEGDCHIGSTLVDMYAKFGRTSDAQCIFDKLTLRDAVSWNAIIKGYGMNHAGKKAVEYFEDMQKEGIKPDGVTFTCLLSACSHARLVGKGQEIFELMSTVYGVIPTMDHYNCMIDILSRAGRIYEALRFIDSMPCSPSVDMWTALLSACKVHAETDLGFACFQQLVKADAEWAVPYVLMWNIYVSVGRLEDANKIEELRKKAGAKKKPARALIEVNKKVHEFVVGRNDSKEVASMLETLQSRMESRGCVPNLELVAGLLSDDGKEAALCDHAEKLALAFGLLNTPQGHTLRVTKNMRMCSDCHITSKTISRIEKREIIIREVYQVHRFKDGLCSCEDNG